MKDFKKSSGFAKRSFGARPSFGAKRAPRPFGGRDFDRPMEMHQATCNECHKLCEVPFRPNGKKPVYCRDCFKDAERAPSAPSYSRSEDSRGEEHGSSDLKKQFNVLNTKLDKLIAAIEEQTRALSSAKE
ncbi:MAG TPA: CxxC-x17-CxxC domain-containing protein [Candidatus Paceibacterota bacterium]|nr:CxxC-x17-CxxC domain-containing protein [Candidatus Paceibacterota bacterium]